MERVGGERLTRGMRSISPPGRGKHTRAPQSGRKSYSREASFADWETVEAPPPNQESGEGKVLSGPVPSLPTGPARPLPAGGPGRCRPSPSPAPTLPPGHTPCPLLAFPESRLSPSPTHLPGRLRRSPLTPPAATVHTHRLRSRTHSPSLTHSATTDAERPTYYASLACYVPRARARAHPDLARGSGQWAEGEIEEPRGLLGNEVRLVGEGPTSLHWCLCTSSPRIDFWAL